MQGINDIPLLKPNEIRARVTQTMKLRNEVCAQLILYKSARVDMDVLDRAFGPFGWQRRHSVINDNLFCSILIWDEEKKQWIEKQDVGVESSYAKEKGEASDAFKRACVNIGIGRELYTSPTIWITLLDKEYKVKKGKGDEEKYDVKANVKFSVSDITYNSNREILTLSLIDHNGVSRFKWAQKTEEDQYDDRLNGLRKAIKKIVPKDEIREEASVRRFGKTFMQLSESELQAIYTELNKKRVDDDTKKGKEAAAKQEIPHVDIEG